MAKKFVALLVAWIVVAAALHVKDAEAKAHTDTFENCKIQCHVECRAADYDSAFCGEQCNVECSARAAAAKRNAQMH